MPLVIIGVLLMAAKAAEFGPFANWSWWIILAPFAGAVLWWHFADSSGWTKRRAMNKMEEKRAKRREKALDALGLNTARDRQLNAARAAAERRRAASEVATKPAPASASRGSSAPSPAADPRKEPRM